MKRTLLEVVPDGFGNWDVTVDGETEYREHTQAKAIKKAEGYGACIVAIGGIASLKIKRPNGTIRDERTYPRSSDPRRSRG